MAVMMLARWTESDVGGGGHPHVCMEKELGDLLRNKPRCVSLIPPFPPNYPLCVCPTDTDFRRRVEGL
jgi:hypothetical protein